MATLTLLCNANWLWKSNSAVSDKPKVTNNFLLVGITMQVSIDQQETDVE
jgi:hypothetical protein